MNNIKLIMNIHTAKRKIQLFVSLVLSLLFFVNNAFAQEDEKEYDEKVIVLGSYNPTVSDANKILFNPTIEDSTDKNMETQYYINSQQIETVFEVKPINAANLVGESLTKLYKRYIKFGFGNYTTPYFNFHLSNLRSKDVNYGVEIFHHSSSSKIKEFAPANFSHNKALVYGSKLWRSHRMNAQFYFDRDVVHFYGFKPPAGTEIQKSDIRQRFMRLGTDWQYHSTYTDSTRLNHAFRLNYQFLNDIYGMQENEIRFGTDINKDLKLFSFTKSQTLGIKGDVKFYNTKDSLSQTNNAAIILSPYLSTTFREFDISLGANACVPADTSAEMFFTPNIELGINIIKKYLVVYAGADGGLEYNAYTPTIDKNPFIVSGINRAYTKSMNLYAGIKGGIGHYIDYNIKMSLSDIDNMPLFMHDTTSTRRNMFTLVYDDVELFNVHGQIAFNKKEKLGIILEANYNQPNPTSYEKAWHMPLYDGNISFRYHIADKIIVKSDVFVVGERYVPVFNEVSRNFDTEKLDFYVDANLGVEYRITKLLSGFLNINNLAASRYYRWYDYPSQRFNMMLGVTYGL
jgi:hypothetical protein